jgi:hypothetical protein
MDLVKKNNRVDLLPKVRLAARYGGLETNLLGHVWIQLLEEGRWTGFETTDETPSLRVQDVKSYSKSSLEQRSRIDDLWEPHYVTSPGTNRYHVFEQSRP